MVFGGGGGGGTGGSGGAGGAMHGTVEPLEVDSSQNVKAEPA